MAEIICAILNFLGLSRKKSSNRCIAHCDFVVSRNNYLSVSVCRYCGYSFVSDYKRRE